MTKEYLIYDALYADTGYPLKYGHKYEVHSRWTKAEEYSGYDRDSVETSYTSMVEVWIKSAKGQQRVFSAPANCFTSLEDLSRLKQYVNDRRMHVMQQIDDLKQQLKKLDKQYKTLEKIK